MHSVYFHFYNPVRQVLRNNKLRAGYIKPLLHIIFSWNYGVELQDLIGKPMDYVMVEVERRITEALTQDDRIDSVDNFEFEVHRKTLIVKFTVHTKFGNAKIEKEVDV